MTKLSSAAMPLTKISDTKIGKPRSVRVTKIADSVEHRFNTARTAKRIDSNFFALPERNVRLRWPKYENGRPMQKAVRTPLTGPRTGTSSHRIALFNIATKMPTIAKRDKWVKVKYGSRRSNVM